MRRTLFYLITLTLFTFVKVNANAQEISDFSGFQNKRVANHTFSVAHTGSGGGAFCPNTSMAKFGIFHRFDGITPSDVTKEMLLDVLQGQKEEEYGVNFVPTSNSVTISEYFQYYDSDTSSYQDFVFTGKTNSDGDIEFDERFNCGEYIFCWIVNGRLWYCYITTAGLFPRYAYSAGEEEHYVYDFVYDAYTNPYGMFYFDL